MNRRIVLPALAMTAWPAIWLPTLVAQSSEPSYSIDGAWFGLAAVPGRPAPLPFMDIFTSDLNSPGQSGTVLCTLQLPSMQSPMGQVSLTPTGHGNWVRTGNNKFAFTVSRVLMDANGRPVSKAKFWGAVASQTFDTITGTMNYEYYDQDGKAFASGGPMTVAWTWVGPRLTASPNPIAVTGSAFLGSTTLSWTAPDAQMVEIHIVSPDGPLFAATGNRGSIQTGNWVADGTTFYLQDVTGGKPLSAENTLATLVVHLEKK
jgi:hypothetical protein